MTIRRRIEALEAGSNPELPSEVRRWLGWSVVENEVGVEVDRKTNGTSGLSKELKTWLGID